MRPQKTWRRPLASTQNPHTAAVAVRRTSQLTLQVGQVQSVHCGARAHTHRDESGVGASERIREGCARRRARSLARGKTRQCVCFTARPAVDRLASTSRCTLRQMLESKDDHRPRLGTHITLFASGARASRLCTSARHGSCCRNGEEGKFCRPVLPRPMQSPGSHHRAGHGSGSI
jgi:hypothetical protein